MNDINSAYDQQWLMIVLMHILTCVRLGKEYKAEDENNTAVVGVLLADALMQAYSERFGDNGGSDSAGGKGAVVVSKSVGNISNAIDKAMKTDSANHNLARQLIDSTKSFEPTAKAFQEQHGNPISPSRPGFRK
jgi:hypothetical protein